ncbi:MAG: hypothetical protein RQ757_10215 [Pseudomonadales bacterium]|nr:hypothetical protein [Pseudomonadales bacterium]
MSLAASTSFQADFDAILPEASLPLAVNQTLRLSFGHLLLEVQHLAFEWIVRYAWSVDNTGWPAHEKELTVRRYVFKETVSTFSIIPLLADRAVVSRPLSPIILMPGSKATIHISTPLWLSLQIGGSRVLELPTVQLSDTWFGNKTGIGELCYSDTTRARLDARDQENLYYKAVTAILFKNNNEKQMPLDRINVPVPLLALFRQVEAKPRFLTTAITATLQSGDDSIRIQLGSGQEHEAGELVSPARKPQKKQLLNRAMELFMG